MRLSKITLQDTTDEAYILAKALIIIGVQDQDVEISSNPSHADNCYHPFTEITLSAPHQKELRRVEVPGVWGTNLVSIDGVKAQLIECATRE